jgi:hypothetical protein
MNARDFRFRPLLNRNRNGPAQTLPDPEGLRHAHQHQGFGGHTLDLGLPKISPVSAANFGCSETHPSRQMRLPPENLK